MSADTAGKILETIIYLKDKVDNEMVTKDDLAQRHDEVLTHIDSFVKLHETLDQELVSLRHKYDRLEQRVSTLENKVKS